MTQITLTLSVILYRDKYGEVGIMFNQYAPQYILILRY